MELIVILLLSVVFLLLLYYIYSLQMSTRNMPPGPFVVPGLGSLVSMWLRKPVFKLNQLRMWEHIDALSKEFGDLIGLNMFGFNLVSINSYELLTEVANMEEYSAKFGHKLITYPRTFGKEMGLIFTYTPALWMEMRKFTVKTLRDFGFGKTYSMHNVITDEVDLIIKSLQNIVTTGTNGGVVKFRNTFSLPVLNVLWCMIAGIRYQHDDPKLLKLLENTFKLSKAATFTNPMEILLPYIGKIVPSFLSRKFRNQVYDEMHQISKDLIAERKAEGKYLTEPENYIDVFLRKIHYESKSEKITVYTEQQLQSMIADLILVGSLTLNSTLTYGILYLTIYPEIQKRCQKEIDSIATENVKITIDDIKKMPYFQAFLLEVHRCANVVPNPIPRLAPTTWKLKQYVIPKDTIILSNHYSVNFDDRIWGDAKAFRPERFLNEKGEFVPDPRVTIFGFGKRICIAIQLVNSVVPLFLSSLLQNFKFAVVKGTKPPTTEPEIGVSLSPQEFSVQLELRKKLDAQLAQP